MWSADPHTHKIDQWMIKFLLNHALPLEGKVQGSDSENNVAQGLEAQMLSQRNTVTTDALSVLMQHSYNG